MVRDHNGQQRAYVYFEDEPGQRSAAKLLRKVVTRLYNATGKLPRLGSGRSEFHDALGSLARRRAQPLRDDAGRSRRCSAKNPNSAGFVIG